MTKWTPQEDQQLKQVMDTMSAREITVRFFSTRTLTSVQTHIALLRKQADPAFFSDVIRQCPRCQNPVFHSNRDERDRAQHERKICRGCQANDYKVRFKGDKNPFHGRSHTEQTKRNLSLAHKGKRLSPEHRAKCVPYLHRNRVIVRDYLSYWIGKLGEEAGRARFEAYQARLSDRNRGKANPMYGKPTPQGSGNGWKGWYRGWHFHSLREIQFYLQAEADGRKCLKIHAHKAYRVPYTDSHGTARTYLPDFLLDDKFIVEIKPKKLWNTNENRPKFDAAKAFFAAKGLTFQVIDIQPDAMTLKEKYLAGEITFTNRYENRFRRHIGLPERSDLPAAKTINRRKPRRRRVASCDSGASPSR